MQNACEVGWPGGTEAKKEGGQITRKGDRHPTPYASLARSSISLLRIHGGDRWTGATRKAAMHSM